MKLEIRRPKGPVEDSVPMRVVAALAVEVSLLAVVAQRAVDPLTAVAAVALAPLGYWFSYRQRRRSNLTTKVLLAVGLLAAFTQFLSVVRMAMTVDQARVPLAVLFLWVQVLHSFDVPRRRDLSFSMVSSVVLMAEAGALSLTTSLIWFLLVWAALAGTWLFLSSAPPAGAVTPAISTRRIRSRHARFASTRLVGLTGAAVMLATAGIFLTMPRLPGTVVRTPPFSLHRANDVSGFDGSVTNPALPAQPGDGVVDFSPNAYPGFGDVVDLQARGHLSNDIAFRVRTPQAQLWRAEVFDRFDGTKWTISSSTTRSMTPSSDGIGFAMPPSTDGAFFVPTIPLTQTFYIDAPQPNVLFGAYRPDQVYFPSGGLKVDQFDSIRSPIFLDSGMVYSVVSTIPVDDPAMLRLVPAVKPQPDSPYLQLPADLAPRVAGLAASITSGAAGEYQAVTAVQSWLRTHTVYDLNVPRDPAGVDAVDHFLFVTRRGYCEQIASSMAILLRTQGIPTRLVTGYGPGTWNPLTGYYEVKQSDAHAWVEVFYPEVGWVPYDPTFGVPDVTGSASRFVAPQVLAAIGRWVRDAVPEPVKHAFEVAARGVSVAVGALARRWRVLAAAAGILAGFAVWLLRRRGRNRAHDPPEAGAGTAFRDLTDALATAGHPRPPAETPSEYLDDLIADPGLGAEVTDAAELVIRTFERERYGRSKPGDADVMRARAAAARVRELVRRG